MDTPYGGTITIQPPLQTLLSGVTLNLYSNSNVYLLQLWHHIHQRTLDQISDHSSTTEEDSDAGLLEAHLSSSRHFEAQLLETINNNNSEREYNFHISGLLNICTVLAQYIKNPNSAL